MKAKKMDGVHLLVKPQDQRKIMETYNFMAIPSYFLIDAQGNMVKDKAKRPSNPALVQDIEAMLEK